jgi:hypothetical protein
MGDWKSGIPIGMLDSSPAFPTPGLHDDFGISVPLRDD